MSFFINGIKNVASVVGTIVKPVTGLFSSFEVQSSDKPLDGTQEKREAISKRSDVPKNKKLVEGTHQAIPYHEGHQTNTTVSYQNELNKTQQLPTEIGIFIPYQPEFWMK